MMPFEYISVLLSIVISIAFAHMLTGIARMIENGVSAFSIPMAHWIGFCLFLCIDYWFYIWSLKDQLVWSFLFVSQLVAQAALIYLASHVITPRPSDNAPVNMTAFFDRSRRKFMSLLFATAAANEALNLMLPGFGTSHLGLLVLAWMITFSIGWISSSAKVQLALVGINILITVDYATSYISEL